MVGEGESSSTLGEGLLIGSTGGGVGDVGAGEAEGGAGLVSIMGDAEASGGRVGELTGSSGEAEG